jgi:hypothetical protein
MLTAWAREEMGDGRIMEPSLGKKLVRPHLN